MHDGSAPMKACGPCFFKSATGRGDSWSQAFAQSRADGGMARVPLITSSLLHRASLLTVSHIDCDNGVHACSRGSEALGNCRILARAWRTDDRIPLAHEQLQPTARAPSPAGPPPPPPRLPTRAYGSLPRRGGGRRSSGPEGVGHAL
eukprot:scaffold78_cov609-Prasinococcus_capsulatus_cf.AAC.4